MSFDGIFYLIAGKTEGRFSAPEASLYARPNDIQDFAAKLQELLDDPRLREQMGRFGQDRVSNDLHWGVEAPKYLQIFKEAGTE